MNNNRISLVGLNAKWFDHDLAKCLRHENLLENRDEFSEYAFIHDMAECRIRSHQWSPTRKQFNLVRQIARRFG